MRRLRLAVLLSGTGTNLRALIDAIEDGLPAEIALVLSNRRRAGGLAVATEAGIATRVVSPADHPDRRACDREVAAVLEAAAPDLVVLAGYMRILGDELAAAWEGRMLNVHPSLLPRHPGLDTHRRALEAGDGEHGSTVHFVTPALDSGPPVLQFRLAPRPWEDAAALEERVKRGEHVIYPRAVGWIADGRLAWRDGGPWFDGEPLRAPKVVSEDHVRWAARRRGGLRSSAA